MKHYRIIAILLVLCILASLTACMPSDPDRTEPETSQTTTAPTTTVPPTTTEPGPKTLHLKDYVTGIDTSVINDDTIITLLRQAETILQEYDIIIIEDNFEIKFYAFYATNMGYVERNDLTWDWKGSKAWEPDCLVTVYTDAIPEAQYEKIRYMILLALVLQEYQDCYYNYDRDYHSPGHMSNDLYTAGITICPSFVGSGYDTMEAFIEDVRTKKLSVGEAGAYCIYGRHINLYPLWTPEFWENSYNGNYWDDHYEKLLSKAFPEE